MSDLTLAGFLVARLDEDEAASREIHEARVCSGCSDGWDAGFDPDRCDCGYPARVLREVEAGRKILELAPDATGLDMQVDQEFRTTIRDTAADPYLGDVLLCILAAVYSDHPDYREEWKP